MGVLRALTADFTANGQTVEIDCSDGGSVRFNISASPTPNLTLAFEVQNEGGEWIAHTGWQTNSTGPTLATSTVPTGAQAWAFQVQGVKRFRVRCGAFTSAARVYLYVDEEPISAPPLLGGSQNTVLTPQSSGGSTTHRTLAASGVNSTSVKGSAGRVYGVQAYNRGTGNYWLHLYNATSVTIGTTVPVKSIPLPAGASVDLSTAVGWSFGTGIRFAITTVSNPSAGDAGVAGGDANLIAVNMDFA